MGLAPVVPPRGPSFTFKTELPTSVKALTFITTVLPSVNRIQQIQKLSAPRFFFHVFWSDRDARLIIHREKLERP